MEGGVAGRLPNFVIGIPPELLQSVAAGKPDQAPQQASF